LAVFNKDAFAKLAEQAKAAVGIVTG